MAADTLRLRKTLAFLLRHRPDIGRLEPDEEGWCDVDQVLSVVSRLMRRRVTFQDLAAVAARDPRWGIEVEPGRIRARSGGWRRESRPPDIVYLSTTREAAEARRGEGELQRPGELLVFHAREQRAWTESHRLGEGVAEVLYVDAARASRAGVRLRRLGAGLYGTESLPTRFVLNLQPDFGVQASAGGFLVRQDDQGCYEVALVRVRRRNRRTWEVAKGKMEPGECPAQTAIRETQEEMGIQNRLEVLADLGVSHYGFATPAGHPRLKVLHLFILRLEGDVSEFRPAGGEGIEDVAFFKPEEVSRVVPHGSLRDPVRRLRRWIQARERSRSGRVTLPPREEVPGAEE